MGENKTSVKIKKLRKLQHESLSKRKPFLEIQPNEFQMSEDQRKDYQMLLNMK